MPTTDDYKDGIAKLYVEWLRATEHEKVKVVAPGACRDCGYEEPLGLTMDYCDSCYQVQLKAGVIDRYETKY